MDNNADIEITIPKPIDKHPLNTKYRDMHKRCEKPYCKSYKWYGARGIKVCDEWSGKGGEKNFMCCKF